MNVAVVRGLPSLIGSKILCVVVSSAIVLAASTPALSQTYRAVNRLVVVPVTQDTFEVIEDRGAGASDIWCAAADYTKAIGRAVTRQRMFVLESRGPSKTRPDRIGVVFTLRPSEELRNSPSSFSVSVNRVGENLAVGHANEFCEVFFDDLLDRF